MELPGDLRYTAEHEWLRVEGDDAVVGITDFAQDSLGDVVFVALPDVGAAVRAGASVGEVESTKSVSDIYAPASGTVVAANDELVTRPELVNEDPYGQGWIYRIALSSRDELDALLTADAYRSLVEG